MSERTTLILIGKLTGAANIRGEVITKNCAVLFACLKVQY